MSYILDALKKADAERERGAVPGLRAQPVVGEVPAAHRSTHRMPWALAGIAGLAALAGAYWLGLGSGPAPSPAAQPTVVTGAAPQANVTPPPMPAPPTPVATPAVTALAAAPRAPAPSAKPSAQVASVSTGTVKPPASPAPAVAQAAATATPAPLLSELPADIRGQVPAITIQGSVYSETPSQRLLLANGQVLNQGANLAPDLTVVEIGKGQSEFSYRGARFRITH